MPASAEARFFRPRARPSAVPAAGGRRRRLGGLFVVLLTTASLAACAPSHAGPSSHPASADRRPSPSASATPPAARNPSAPAPTPGADGSPAPSAPVAAGADGVARVDAGVTVRLSRLASTVVTAETPREMSGDAVIATVEIANGGSAPASVDSMVVELVAADGAYGVGTTAGSPTPLTGTVAPGASVSGSYVFMLSGPRGRSVTLTVSHAAGSPVARFEGTVP